MASRLEKEKAKKQNDRHQSILSEMLHENDNRFCADCNAKGPRWASWNLGVFLCIRCAGIHRNLGVHISRVKSVNLDSWTPEQIDSIQQWGNKRSRDVYEYYLPEDFRRPQGDSAMEAFIRNKYEKKIYLRKDGVPPPDKPVSRNKDIDNKDKQIKKDRKKDIAKIERPKPSNSVPSSIVPAPAKAQSSTAPQQSSASTTAPTPAPVQSNIADLLSLDTPTPSQEPGLVDLFGSVPPQSTPAAVPQTLPPQVDLFAPQPTSVPQTQGPLQQSQNSQSASDPQAMESALFEEGETKAKSAKDTIMALYQSQSSSQNQMFGVPGGMYMSSSQPKPHAQATQQQPSGYMFNGGMMAFPQQQQQVNMQMGFPQQQFVSQQQQMPQHLQVGQIQQQMQNLQLKHSVSQPNLLKNYPSNNPNNQMHFMTQPQHMTNWLSQPQIGGFQQQPQPQFVTTGPVNNMQGYNMFPMGTTPPVGNTMNNQLWK